LLSNAIKFTEQGEIVLSVSKGDIILLNGELGERVELRFAVHDTGIGIPPDRLDRLFQSFTQVDASTTRKYGGTGLGLAISKRLAEMMGGAMWVESEAGKGSTFHFNIVAEAAPDFAERPQLFEAQPPLSDKRVLIVDDNATNRRILKVQTKAWGMLARDTGSPAEALEWIRRGDPFDLAILDMQMPEMDGLALASEIRRYRDPHALALVLFSSMGHRDVALTDQIFAAYLTKPLKPSHLYNALMMVFAGQTPGKAPLPGKGLPSRPAIDPDMAERLPLKILLAEDNSVNQKLALRLLEQLGYQADVAANGLEVLEALERQRYDVVLMDIQMPEMDGVEATRAIHRRWSGEGHPRIIAMTANAMQGDRETYLEAGMDDYVSKPIRESELVQALERSQVRT
jgi:CheY-like chemotaxis protein